MSHSFRLTPNEKEQLQAAMNDERPEVRQRAKALLLLDEGNTFAAVANAVGVKTRKPLYAWLKRWRAAGIEGLLEQPRQGRPPLATEEYRKLLETVMAEFAQDMHLMDAKALNTLMEEKTGVEISDKRFRTLLNAMGYSFKRHREPLEDMPCADTLEGRKEWRRWLKSLPPHPSDIYRWGK
ncbi:MAG: helix-turn-helix domain-containing protein [Chloroflexi bacterium]|nr:helix-turn-helix domain-containing protein [Chloroflexota bacterium]